jgi:hypothetical protein
MTSLSSLARDALGRTEPLRGFELLTTLSRLHRVQGSEDLVVAAEHVAMQLEELGIETRLDLLRGPLGLHEHYGFWEPRGWRLREARVERRRSDGGWETVSSTSQTPLVAMVHSPPGSVEADASYAKPRPGARGSGVVVTDEPGWEGYYVLAEQGYEAVIGFHTGPGVRYWGIYPPPFEEPPAAPAASLEAEKALSLVGERVRVTVEAEYMLPATPVLTASIGDPSGPAVVLVAHLCHPSPGAHDNASGVAVVMETLAVMKGHEQLLAEKGLRVVAVLAPEWTGTAAAIQQGVIDPESIVLGVSVDMVAANLATTGGRMRVVSSPPPLASPLDPLLVHALQALDPENQGPPGGYEWGSDHDILLGHGIAASMLNEWPDRYYHSSLDTPDHIEPARLATTAAALAAAVLRLAMGPETGVSEANVYTRAVASHYVLEGAPQATASEVMRLTGSYLHHLLARLQRREPPQPWERDIYPTRRPPYSRTYIHKLLRDEQLLRDRGLREAARLAATLAAATGSWGAAAAAYQLLARRTLEPRVEEKTRLLLGVAE